MLLGAAGAGRSSLKHGLMHLPFDSNIDSTIVANIESLRPVDYQWATAEWRDLSPDDELDELSQLLAHIPSRGETVLSDEEAVCLYPSLPSIVPLDIKKQEIARVDTIIDDTVNQTISKPISYISKTSTTSPCLGLWGSASISGNPASIPYFSYHVPPPL